MAPKMRNRKSTGDDNAKRIVVIDHGKCKPNSDAFHYLKKNAGGCGKNCIIVEKKTVVVAESACPVCLNRCKQCPGDAVTVVKLPTNLTSDTTHRFGANSFKIHGLPAPRPGHVLGLLGTNGTGKSSAISILSGRLKPNLGHVQAPFPEWMEIITYYRGSDLQNYFTNLIEDKIQVAVKPQLEAGFARRLKGKVVREQILARDERGTMDKYVKELGLQNVLDREVQDLSGGELQRFAIACTLCRDADIYMFDEATSFLDVKQRLQVTESIRNLVHGGTDEWGENGEFVASKKYVVVIEHDLAILDYMSDFVQCLYGQSGVYGVVTPRSRVRNGINQFLAGYIPSQNMRFRSYELTFKVTTSDFQIVVDEENCENDDDRKKKSVMGVLTYPNMTKSLVRYNDAGKEASRFTLHVKSGSFRDGECIVLLGENGTGKTTFMELLAGRNKEQRGKEKCIGAYDADNIEDGVNPSLTSLGVSYKTQGMNPKLRRFKGNVRLLLEQEINPALSDRMFRLLVIKALNIEAIYDLPVASLSGGEMQRLSITICLGKPALVYLIDEPSAGLDCEQRILAAKIMKRWVVNHLHRTIFLVEHDFLMAASMADRAIVYEGTPGIECVASSPCSVADGFNKFLKMLNVTFRRDPVNLRPRINKKNSRLDQIQKANGEYYLFDIEDDMNDDEL